MIMTSFQSTISELLRRSRRLQRNMDEVLQNSNSQLGTDALNKNSEPPKLMTNWKPLSEIGNATERCNSKNHVSFVKDFVDNSLASINSESDEDFSESYLSDDGNIHSVLHLDNPRTTMLCVSSNSNVDVSKLPNNFEKRKSNSSPLVSSKQRRVRPLNNLPSRTKDGIKTSVPINRKQVPPLHTPKSALKSKNETKRVALTRLVNSSSDKVDLDLHTPRGKTDSSTQKPSDETDHNLQRTSDHFAEPTAQQIGPMQKGFLLHCIVMVPFGIGFATSSRMSDWHPVPKTRNLYLICRMFWTEDTVHSRVCWNSNNPRFEFSQMAPILVTEPLLKRMQNNIMVLEVWEKKPSSQSDEIVGICKLPLHIFYLSFRDHCIAKTILQSSQAVSAINDYVPVVDIFSGKMVGKLKVLLAMGTHDQLKQTLQSAQDRYQEIIDPSLQNYMGYSFEFSIPHLNLVQPPGSSIWGESDCYVCYVFPTHDSVSNEIGDLKLQTFTIGPHLCEAQVKFESPVKHKIVQSASIPFQKCLLQVFSRHGIPFQVWCKYYYPCECEELVAEACLPMHKFCSLIGQKERNDARDSFVLPLIPCGQFAYSVERGTKLDKLGTLEVEVSFERLRLSENEIGSAIAINASCTEKSCQTSLSVTPTEFSPHLLEEQPHNSKVTFRIFIEKGIHLTSQTSKPRDEELPLNSCCSIMYANAHGSPTLVSNIILSSSNPCWNWQTEITVTTDSLLHGHKQILIHVWHIDIADQVNREGAFNPVEKGILIGFASIDMMPLLLGLQQLNGWYNIIGAQGECKGQVKVIIEALLGQEQVHEVFDQDFKKRSLAANSSQPFGANHGLKKESPTDERLEHIQGEAQFELKDASKTFLLTSLRENLYDMEKAVNQFILEDLKHDHEKGIRVSCAGLAQNTDENHPIRADSIDKFTNASNATCANLEEVLVLPATEMYSKCTLHVLETEKNQPHLTHCEPACRIKKSRRVAASIFICK